MSTATWRDRGVVPDSDDEEDSQELTCSLLPQISDLRDKEESTQTDCAPRSSLDLGADIGWLHSLSQQAEESTDLPLLLPKENPSQTTHNACVSDKTQDARQLWVYQNVDFQNEGNGENTSVGSIHNKSNSSQALSSSPLSSPPTLSPQSPSFRDLSTMDELDITRPDSPDESLIAAARHGRTFRDRRPIQVNPYTVENLLHRRIFLQSGLRPVAVAQRETQTTETTLPSSSLPSGSQTESQGESQSASTSCGLQSEGLGVQNTDGFQQQSSVQLGSSQVLSQDDDLPSISELARQTWQGDQGQWTISAGGDTLTKPSFVVPDDILDDIYNVPPSPPISSPPIIPASRTIRHRRPATATPANNGRHTRFVSGDKAAIDLPTPGTDPAGRSAPIAIPSSDAGRGENSSDDGIISAPLLEEGDVSESEPEPDAEQTPKPQLETRRLRGVLPASWVRLDQESKALNTTRRERPRNQDLNSRRGVAVRKIAADRANHGESPVQTAHMTISSDSEDSEEERSHARRGPLPPVNLSRLPTESQDIDIWEDNRIDAMIPEKRQRQTSSNFNPRKRQRTGLFRKRSEPYLHQPTITEHLPPSHVLESSRLDSNITRKTPRITKRQSNPSKSSRPRAPRLSIIDVTACNNVPKASLPKFIRVAARSARSRPNNGRHSPSRKFIRLAKQSDTQDAQRTLRDWREGTIQPLRPSLSIESPLSIISDNQQSSPTRHRSHQQPSARHKQTLLHPVVISYPEEARHTNSGSSSKRSRKAIPARQEIAQVSAVTRPAQLETEETSFDHLHPNQAFSARKKKLDTLFRRTRKGTSSSNGDDLLARFLADDDPLAHDLYQSRQRNLIADTPATDRECRIPRRKKTPVRLDAGATEFRQPREPLVLKKLPLQVEAAAPSNARLRNLGDIGTEYPVDFNIMPLKLGTCFHEGTFIGSGKLSKAVVQLKVMNHSHLRNPSIYNLDHRTLRWGTWDENVSSELGLCFDWLLERMDSSTSHSSKSATGVMDFILAYMQESINFNTPSDLDTFLCRVYDEEKSFINGCQEIQSKNQAVEPHIYIEILSRNLVILMQALQWAKVNDKHRGLQIQLEELISLASSSFAKLLYSQGRSHLQELYDSLEYLSVREAGIRGDQFIVQAWIILIQVLQAARISRTTFWDVLNPHLIPKELDQVDDASTLEELWYHMFLFLPLCEFDSLGIVRPGSRYSFSYENWTIPQRIVRRIFGLYSQRRHQSPNFAEYCRTTLCRCHHLIEGWGWKKFGTIVGSIFDAFAGDNLMHLRNDEAYSSPKFLQELHSNPSLVPEPDDRCFHLFLKLIANSIRHLRSVDDTNGIRNIAIRLIPNHDRQYPKEEDIHQADLISLRNHHDILCTLFWALPTNMHSSLKLIKRLRELVVPERSHQEACVINLQAWSYLAQFIVSKSPTYSEYQSLVDWHSDFMEQLSRQYETAEQQANDQLGHMSLARKQMVSTEALRRAVRINMSSILSTIYFGIEQLRSVCSVESIPSQGPGTSSFSHLIQTHAPELRRLLDFCEAHSGSCPQPLEDLRSRILELEQYIQISPASNKEVIEEDSQEYGPFDEEAFISFLDIVDV